MSVPASETSSRRRFELKRRIGAGAFGEVFLAEQVGAGGFRRPVALKLLNETASRMKEAARRMRDEARILGRLQHRHLVDVLDLVQLGDRWAVVMAYVPGADLEQILLMLEEEQGRIPGTVVAEIGGAVARAMHAAWSAEDANGECLQVVHRDIKPSNIRLTPDGEIKVLDFGVAQVRMVGREAETRRQGLMGTERYMAPERILMEGDGPEGDVYALAATIAELVIGEPIGRTPVREGPHVEWVEAALVRVGEGLRGPEEAVEGFKTLLAEALQSDPAARPDARTMATRFELLSRQLQGPVLSLWSSEVVPRVPEALGTGSGEPVSGTLIEGSGLTPSEMSGAQRTTLPPSEDPEDRRSTALLLPLLVLALLLSVGAGVLGWASMQPPAPREVAVSEPSGSPEIVAVERSEGAEDSENGASLAADEAREGAADPDPETREDQTSAPEPAPASEAKPEASSPSRPASRSARPSLAPSTAEPSAAEGPAPDREPASAQEPPAGQASPAAPRVSRAMVVVEDVDGFEVVCGDRQVAGTASARIADFPAGTCTVTARLGARTAKTRISIDAPGAFRCTLEQEGLSCR